MLVANVIYGVNYTIAKVALPQYVKPFAYIFTRVSVAMVLFWLIWMAFIRERIRWKDLPRFAICGLFGVAMNQLLFFNGLARTTEINASLIMITTPILVLVLSHFFIGERITFFKIIGICMAGLGAFFLIGFGRDFSFGSATAPGDLMVLANASSYGMYLVLVKPLMKNYRPLTVITTVFTFGFVVVAIAGFRQFIETEWATFGWEIWASVGFVVLFTTFFAYLLNIYALKKVNPSLVSVYMYAQPLIATFVAISFGNDFLTVVKVLAGMLIILGVFLTSQIGRDTVVKLYKKASL